MKKFKFLTLVFLPVLAACSNVAPVTNPPVDFATKAQYDASKSVSVSEQWFRTYTKSDKGSVVEVTGATCIAESAQARAKFVTPALIRVPVYAGRPTTMSVKCALGDKSFSKTVEPKIDGTVFGGASAAGLVAAVVTAGIAAGRDQWSYGLASASETFGYFDNVLE